MVHVLLVAVDQIDLLFGFAAVELRRSLAVLKEETWLVHFLCDFSFVNELTSRFELSCEVKGM